MASLLVMRRRNFDIARRVSVSAAPTAAKLCGHAAFPRGGYGDPPRNMALWC
jgi:hypothetical protein